MTETPPPLLRHHRLALAEAPAPGTLERARLVPGILAAEMADGRLVLTCDLRRLTLTELTPRLSEAGIRLSPAWTARMARAWAGFKDDNLRDQSRLVHQCCNLPPDKH